MKPFYALTTPAICLVILSCNSGWEKSTPGLEYKVISHKQSETVQPGETLKMHIRQVYKDSVLSDTRDSIPFYQCTTLHCFPPNLISCSGRQEKGDSLIFKALSDLAFKRKMPSFARKGEYLFTYVKIEGVFGVKEDFKADMRERNGEVNRKKNLSLPQPLSLVPQKRCIVTQRHSIHNETR
jgi:hypothetical protein